MVSRVRRSPEMVSSVSSSVLVTCSVKRFRRLLQDALRLLGALQQVADLFCRGHARSQFLAEQQRQFVTEQHQAGIGRRNGQNVVLQFKRHKVVAEHQVRRNGAEKFRIDALFAQIDERNAVAFRQTPGVVAIVLLFRGENYRR